MSGASLNFITILGIAVGLSMDALAVAIATGATLQQQRLRSALTMGVFFGGFQALMPLVGWLAGRSLEKYIQSFDHWIAFGLLIFIGGKMVWEAFQIEEEENKTCSLAFQTLLMLSVATSIDALAVGVTFAALGTAIAAPVVIIGCTTFLLSTAGVLLGNKVGHFFEGKVEVAGGVILILIGVKILVEHLW